MRPARTAKPKASALWVSMCLGGMLIPLHDIDVRMFRLGQLIMFGLGVLIALPMLIFGPL